MSQAMEKLRKKTTYKPEYGGSRFYCSTFEKILNRLLEHKLKHPKDYSERNRLCVILGYDEGISTKNLAKTLRISPINVQEYLREYDSENKTGSSPRGGSKSKLSQDQTESLLKHLQEKTYK
ncbi:helix-turn-helix domain-containing protein [Candidatus Rhabdochlamydia oedothoracis]|uniref:helix-turn-helix domain-containing protein n=1 Tax=Candidatus Rhabdochlamydia oedothoracis TaxID=2720720 RepID=UPI001C64D3D8|nr:helix-turn-helix domain-containing protein [Candidatus Rhabdochlamydia oedothoracis]